MTIRLDGATYEGNWVHVRGGQAGLLHTWGVGSSFSTSTMAVQNASGVENVLSCGSDGSALRCQFHYIEVINTGIGACKEDDGTLYDMQIVTP